MFKIIGQFAPDFSLEATNSQQINLKKRNKTLVVYFYPKDFHSRVHSGGKGFFLNSIKVFKNCNVKFLEFQEIL